MRRATRVAIAQAIFGCDVLAEKTRPGRDQGPRFTAPKRSRVKPGAGDLMGTFKVTLANRDNAQIEVDARRPLLDSLRDHGIDLPYGCQYGGCITCAAKLTAGEVTQNRQVALNNRQINYGYIILCVARPVTDITLEIGVESHDKLYRNPFLDPLKAHELKADIATPQED